MNAGASTAAGRIDVLDGWRALSILLVLAGHWLPMPHTWQTNGMAAASGMALFFTLSGFLIARLLLKDPRPAPFLARRIFRIVPLAWLAMGILAVWNQADPATVLANFLFYANLGPDWLMRGGEPLWSLCVEVQFYLFCALSAWIAGRRAVYVLPLLGLAVTGLRIADGVPISIHTWHRVDEIMAGASVAVLLSLPLAHRLPRVVPGWACLVAFALLAISAHPQSGALAYLRPYFAAATVGFSILATPGWLRPLLTSRPARYVAEISYALYVFHGILWATPLGGEQASKPVRYALRFPLLAATFALAHLSTRHFESRFIAMGKRIADRFPLSKPGEEVGRLTPKEHDLIERK
ncbi:MAG: acyltransferase [Altererythrobacter sp.]|nr:acyltransferase [Altererythrobacter sp.]